jgi:SulP family sulfate permease
VARVLQIHSVVKRPNERSLSRFVPIASWIREYDGKTLRADAVAGLTTAVMLVPQAMAYAMLAGLPPITGLYASVVPLVVYGVFGTSRQLAVGPVAMVSLLTLTGVSAIAEPGSSEFVAYAVVLSAMVGILSLAMGFLRAGFLVNFLSHPVVAGFTSAAALIIGLSQLTHLLGVHLERSKFVHEILGQALAHLGEVSPITVTIGVASIVTLLLLKRFAPRFPRALVVVVAGTLAVVALGFSDGGVAIVGNVPAGFPTPSIVHIGFAEIRTLLPTALVITLVGFMESISVAKSFARRNRYKVDPDQELRALGLSNIAGSLFGAYPVTGGFSRTAVNAQAGAKTPMASIITAAVVTATLLFLTPLFYYLPKAVLAAIIMTAVFGLVDVKEAKHLWRVKRGDLALMGLTFVATLTLGIEEGILLGVVTSLLVFVVRTTRPHLAVLGRLPWSETYRNVRRFPDARVVKGVLTVRIDAQLYFGNVDFLEKALSRLEREREEPLRAVVLDAAGMNQIDSSAEAALRSIADGYDRRGIAFYVAQAKGPVRDVLSRSGLDAHLGEDAFTDTVHEAVARACGGPPCMETPLPEPAVSLAS